MKLSELKTGEKAIVVRIKKNDLRLRLMELGFVEGTEITILRKSLLYDPVELHLRGYSISLRKATLDLIIVRKK
jgi:ferrous iron transport protein B